jgi:hypothetical protein
MNDEYDDSPYRDWDERRENISKLSREQLEDIVFWALHKQTVILRRIARIPDRLERPEIRWIEQEVNDIWEHYNCCVMGEM